MSVTQATHRATIEGASNDSWITSALLEQKRSEDCQILETDEAPRSKLRGITEHSFEDFSETELNPVASYGEYSSLRHFACQYVRDDAVMSSRIGLRIDSH